MLHQPQVIEKQATPQYMLLTLSIVFALLAAIALFFPKEGVRLTSNATITFPGIKDALGIAADVSELNMDCSEEGFYSQPSGLVKNAHAALPLRCTPDDVRALPLQPIQYPKGYEHILEDTWMEFATAKNSPKPVRVLHYGDSQLEADRMTLYLRNQLQSQFGGGGVGFVALDPQIPINPTVKISMSENWQHSTPAVKSKAQEGMRIGHLLSNVKLPSNSQPKSAWIRIDRRPLRTYPTLRYSRIRLFLGNSRAPVTIEAKTPTKRLYSRSINPSEDVQQIELIIPNNRENVTLTFSGRGCPEIYGLALDYRSGLAVDNIPLRSSNGVDFTKADINLLKRSYDKLNAKFIILQFGANVVPKMMSSYSYYEQQMYEQLQLLKQVCPQSGIVVVGVSDMAKRGANGNMISYPNIEKVRNAQKQAAFRAGCAFWDTYEAMGGRNSIVSWAYATPVLASKDFCHFSADGAALIAELFCRALAQEYGPYATQPHRQSKAVVSSAN
ncbi:MAG: hypothetical protein LBK47_02905 [Prevotellaceae bacterium]|jgi:hypothetical protein|nr:hypothetical protein [Prevotellaceae bacterium]